MNSRSVVSLHQAESFFVKVLFILEKRIVLKGVDPMAFYGARDVNLRFLEDFLNAEVVARGNEMLIRGSDEDVREADKVISELILLVNRNGSISPDDVETVSRLSSWQKPSGQVQDREDVVLYTKRDPVKPKTAGQRAYFQSAQENDIVFAIGPAGTGKTFLAVAIALSFMREKIVDRIVLCRPAVEAGENLGFLPGDLREKVDPYLRPLYDALLSMIHPDKLRKQMDASIIEIAPLAYMRGRTLNNSFVILDEAQNTTSQQMKMFLTRLGPNSRAIITGDITQIDLPGNMISGLVEVQNILNHIDGIGMIYLNDQDVVRHRLVRKIINAYNRKDDDLLTESTGQNQ